MIEGKRVPIKRTEVPLETEAELVDRVVRWVRNYLESIGSKEHVIPLAFLNRRWGKQVRRFGASVEDVLERDPRFGFVVTGSARTLVSVRVGETREEAQAARESFRRLWNGEVPAAPVGAAPEEPEVSEDVRRLAELMSDPEA